VGGDYFNPSLHERLGRETERDAVAADIDRQRGGSRVAGGDKGRADGLAEDRHKWLGTVGSKRAEAGTFTACHDNGFHCCSNRGIVDACFTPFVRIDYAQIPVLTLSQMLSSCGYAEAFCP
jgi:hypothetical protein